MGVVYEGRQGYLDRCVAVKLLAQDSQSDEFVRRFQREAKILASLNHPHVVSCYQAGIAPDGRCFLVMEYIDGPTLSGWIDSRGALPHDRAVEICRDVASALAYANRSSIIHRDVKPANILLKSVPDRDPGDPFPYQAMLADLGLARASGELPTQVDITLKGITTRGAVMGSPPTMAPEQFDNPHEVDFRTDIYGLGCVLFQCLTGKLAFPQGTLTRLIARKTEGKPPDPRELRADVARELASLVADMLAPDPRDRPASYEELLRRLAGPFGAGARTRSRLLATGAALAVLAGGWLGGRALLGGGASPQEDHAALVPEPAPLVPLPLTDADDDPGREEDGPARDATDGDEMDPEQEGSASEPDPAPPIERDPVDSEPSPVDAERVLADAGADPVEAEWVLPDLPSIRAGETRALLKDSVGVLPLEGWEAVAGDLAAWTRLEDGRDGAQALLFDGRNVAAHGLPAPPWRLSGKLEMIRPGATSRLCAVLVLQEGLGILLEQSGTEEGVCCAGFVARSRSDGGWVAERELQDLSLGAKTRDEYRRRSPVAFEVAWDGERLSLSWSLGGEDGARVELARDELRSLGAPVGIAVELEEGAAKLHQFTVEGR
jgi:serine/threonine-protein kinase